MNPPARSIFSWPILTCLTFATFASARPHASFELIDPDENNSPEARSASAPSPAPRKFNTFAHWVLDLESQANYVSPAKYAALDSIIQSAKNRTDYDPSLTKPRDQRRQALRILRAIDQTLTDHNILYPPGEYDTTELRLGLSPQTFDRATLRRILKVNLNGRRREHALANADKPFYILDCDTCSLVYLGIADACGFADRLHLTDLPDHMLVRWVFADGSYLNWDTNDAAVIEDQALAADYDLTRNLRKRRIYLSTMTRDEAKGHAYYLRAGTYENRGDFANSIADMQKVLELIPQSTQAKSDLAWLYATTKDLPHDKREEAIKLATAAIELEPKSGEFWDTLAIAHAANADFNRAVECANKAVKLAADWQDRAKFRSRRRDFENGKMPALDD